MANGWQLAEQNWLTFQRWTRDKTDDDYRQMVLRGVLSRSEIAAECGFSKSALHQNPKIKAALREIEEGLRTRGVLPPLAGPPGAESAAPAVDNRHQRSAIDAERLKRLEQDNACLREEMTHLRQENARLKQQVQRHAQAMSLLAATGRLPR